jgi:phosphinothricin acetyltransferase
MRIVDCRYEAHAGMILEILNEAIVNSTALYDYKPRAAASMHGWFEAKRAAHFPILGVVNAADQLLGFASYGTFRAWPAYKYSIEHSVYVHTKHRRKGVGLALMKALISAATLQQYHALIGGIDLANTGSIALHQQLGFLHAGTIKEAGFKFGRWLDLAFYQLLLPTPQQPVDG